MLCRTGANRKPKNPPAFLTQYRLTLHWAFHKTPEVKLPPNFSMATLGSSKLLRLFEIVCHHYPKGYRNLPAMQPFPDVPTVMRLRAPLSWTDGGDFVPDPSGAQLVDLYTRLRDSMISDAIPVPPTMPELSVDQSEVRNRLPLDTPLFGIRRPTKIVILVQWAMYLDVIRQVSRFSNGRRAYADSDVTLPNR